MTAIGDRFDVMLDTVGSATWNTGLPLLTDHGSQLLVVAGFFDTLRATTEVAGGLDSPPEAHRLVDSGRKIGNLVVLPHGDQE